MQSTHRSSLPLIAPAQPAAAAQPVQSAFPGAPGWCMLGACKGGMELIPFYFGGALP